MKLLSLLCRVLFSFILFPDHRVLTMTASHDRTPNTLVVTTNNGFVRGVTTKTVSGWKVDSYLSIPYAKPPIGKLRFRDPLPISKWDGVLDVSERAPRCIQMDAIDKFRIKGEEDCLYLAVYTPQNITNNRTLPTMVFFHGGSWFHGGGSIYGPKYLLDNENVILVTVNYRVGPFGFLTTGDKYSPGNQGLKDQVLALKWVRDNIRFFGGDDKSVTIWGHSVGASAVQLHIASPLSRGLFHRAIADSGSAFCYWAVIEDGREIGQKTATLFNCPTNGPVEMINCLRNVSATVLVSAEAKLTSWYGPLAVFGPTIEAEGFGAFLTKPVREYFNAEEASKVPMLGGVMHNEGGRFVFPFFQNESHIDEINSNRKELLPVILGLVDDPLAQVKVSIIWEFYMKTTNVSWSTRENIANMYGDRAILECTLDGLFSYAKYSNMPVYAYDFTHQGRYSIIQKLGGRPKDWGVVHNDQLIYLLNNTDYYADLNLGDPELEMSKIITYYWTNFAAKGNPNAEVDSSECKESWLQNRFQWWPLQKGFADLSMKQAMMENPFETRYKFWKQLESYKEMN